MPKVDAVTKQWIRGPADELAVRNGCYFDLAAAERVRRFFRQFLRLPPPQSVVAAAVARGEAIPPPQPLELIGWQWDGCIGPLFGWKRPDQSRRYRRGYWSVAKKNGKTELVSALLIYLLLADGEENAEVYSVAGSREQAGLVYAAANRMRDKSPQVKKLIRNVDSTKRLVAPRNSFYRTLSSEHSTSEGINAHGVIYDELHSAKGRELFDALKYAGSARRQPVSLTITTAGDGADPAHICREQYDYAKAVERGEIKDWEYLPYIAEAPAGCDLDDPAAWRAANPSLGVTLREEDLAAAAAEAKASPAAESSFRRYKLNQWVSNAEAWLSDTLFDALPADLDPATLAGRTCYAGIDLSSTDDLTAAVYLFPPPEGSDVVDILVQPFVPGENVQRLERKHRVPYAAWARDGHLLTTPGNVVDYDSVCQRVRKHAEAHPIKMIGLDRKFQGASVEQDLIEDGFDVAPIGAGWVSQDAPLKEIEKRVKSLRLRHAGNPVLRWNMLSAVVKTDDAGNYSLTKRLSRAKVDCVAALVCAVAVWMHDEANREPGNYYEKHPELIVLDF